MKIFCFLCFFIFQQLSNAVVLDSIVGFVPLCMTVTQLNTANTILCGEQKSNETLWNLMIDCHRPMDDTFLRESNEANCPSPKKVNDPTDTNYSLNDVFFNICGLIDGSPIQRGYGQLCIASGHIAEVAAVQAKWGTSVTCDVGKCVKKVFADANLDLGLI